jgi:MoxR-like ATPase
MSPSDVGALQYAIRDVHVNQSLYDYVLDIVTATRSHPAVTLGASPRGSLALIHASQAAAVLAGRDYIVPDDIKSMAAPVLAHRIHLRPEQRVRGVSAQSCIADILQRAPVPVGAK